MKKIIVSIIVIAHISGCSIALKPVKKVLKMKPNWTENQKRLLFVGGALHLFDMYCSYHYVEDGNELNPVYASMNPWEAVGSMMITGVGSYVVANWLDEYRTPFLFGFVGLKTVITINNVLYDVP